MTALFLAACVLWFAGWFEVAKLVAILWGVLVVVTLLDGTK